MTLCDVGKFVDEIWLWAARRSDVTNIEIGTLVCDDTQVYVSVGKVTPVNDWFDGRRIRRSRTFTRREIEAAPDLEAFVADVFRDF